MTDAVVCKSSSGTMEIGNEVMPVTVTSEGENGRTVVETIEVGNNVISGQARSKGENVTNVVKKVQRLVWADATDSD